MNYHGQLTPTRPSFQQSLQSHQICQETNGESFNSRTFSDYFGYPFHSTPLNNNFSDDK